MAVVSDDDLSFVSALRFVASVQHSGNALTANLTDVGHGKALLAALIEHDIDVISFDATPTTLHEIFVALTGHGEDTLAEEVTQ